MSQMSFQVKRGLAEFGYSDHYAVLGLGIDASAEEIRKRYLKLARLLHPDSAAATDKELASQVLSKLVNPAYQYLCQEKERTDFSLLLKLVGQRANLEFDPAKFFYPTPQALLTAAEYESLYQETLQELSEQQFGQLNQVVPVIEHLSELNLALLMRREAAPSGHSSINTFSHVETASVVTAAVPTAPEVAVTTQARQPTEKRTLSSDDFIRQYVTRAETLIAKQLYQDALKELRDALKKLDPQNSRCHALIGVIYLKQNQPKMAKVHLNQALKSDPNNAEALEGIKELKKQEAQVAKSPQPSVKATQVGAKGGKTEERRGLFGLFGGKK
jgi:tetratricopeptide (TPR) repeat protein